jgi:adenylate cyclase
VGTDQAGFADTILDGDGVVRRAALFMDDGTTVYHSFALRLALAHLAAANVFPQADASHPELMRLGKVALRPLEPDDGGYVSADAGGYQILVDYKDAGIEQVSISSVLSGDMPVQIRDRIVIVGTAAESVKDFFYTPLSGSTARPDPKMFGVEVHGRIASQLTRAALDGDAPTRTLRKWQENAWTLFWTMLGALAGFRVRSLWRFSAVGLSGLAVLGAADYAGFLQGWWLPLVPAVLGAALAATSVTSYISYQEKHLRTLLMQIFSRHVSPSVADVIWQERDQLIQSGRMRPQKMVATVLFSDLQGYTTMSESLQPQEVMDWLNVYMESMVACVMEHGGTVDKFIGDAIMAVFGAPLPSSTSEEIRRDAVNAVKCALAMDAALARLNEKWRKDGLPVSGMRIGIFTGPVVAGSLGSSLRSEYTLIGDTVNTASRLESYDKKVNLGDQGSACRILIGASTLGYLGDEFDTVRVGAVQLKGKEEQLDVFQVLGLAKTQRVEVAKEAAR